MYVKRMNGEIIATAKRPQPGWPVEKLADDDAEVVTFLNPPEPPDPHGEVRRLSEEAVDAGMSYGERRTARRKLPDAVESAVYGDVTLNAIYRATADALGVSETDFMASIKSFAVTGETGATGP